MLVSAGSLFFYSLISLIIPLFCRVPRYQTCRLDATDKRRRLVVCNFNWCERSARSIVCACAHAPMPLRCSLHVKQQPGVCKPHREEIFHICFLAKNEDRFIFIFLLSLFLLWVTGWCNHWGTTATVAVWACYFSRGTRPKRGATTAMAVVAAVKFLPWR